MTYDYSLLPPHIIHDILKCLNGRHLLDASRTCKSWYYESLKSKLNKIIRVRIKSTTLPNEFNRQFGILVLQEIDFNVFCYDVFLQNVGHHIHEIELENCKLSLNQLFSFISYLPNLISFKLRSNEENILNLVNFLDTKLEEEVELIFRKMNSFEICLSYPDVGGLKYIMALMPNLKVISIGLQKPSVNYIFDILFEYFNQFDEVNLERLSISDLEGGPVHQFFSDFVKIIPNLNIRTVSLGMISTSSYMTYHEANFTTFCKKLSNVNVFSMRGPRECHFIDICRYMRNLKELYLTYAAIKNFRGIEKLKHLEKLHLTCTVCYRGSNYDEDEFINMFTKLEHLKELSLNLYPITDRVLDAMCRNCISLTRLEILRTKTCNFVPIFQYLLNLKSLRLHMSALVEYKKFDVDKDITNLRLLEEIDINAFVPGLTLDLIELLPNLKASSLHMMRTNVFTNYGSN